MKTAEGQACVRGGAQTSAYIELGNRRGPRTGERDVEGHGKERELCLAIAEFFLSP